MRIRCCQAARLALISQGFKVAVWVWEQHWLGSPAHALPAADWLTVLCLRGWRVTGLVLARLQANLWGPRVLEPLCKCEGNPKRHYPIQREISLFSSYKWKLKLSVEMTFPRWGGGGIAASEVPGDLGLGPTYNLHFSPALCISVYNLYLLKYEQFNKSFLWGFTLSW